ncbi:DDE-type integrase/transposase/recombinase [Bernardetia sp. ABR2-2B]|uniref:DDE-type integrase/transposase/recombinase n=1 Tax=Bernardetia sp. ABR2-2B TaxID=3127472 RepID=UPI0030CC123F
MNNSTQNIELMNDRIIVSYKFLENWYTRPRRGVAKGLWESAKKGWVFFDSVIAANNKVCAVKDKKDLPTLKELEAILAEEVKKPSKKLLDEARTWEKDNELSYFLSMYETTQAYEYAAISAWKRMIYFLGDKKNKITLKAKGFKNKKSFLQECVKCIQSLNFTKWNCKDFVVLNQQVFVQYKKLVEQFGDDAFRKIIDERTEVSCKNSSKITEQIQQDYLVYLASDHRKFSFELITELYNAKAAEKGWEVLKTPAPVITFLEQPSVKPIWTMQREPKLYNDTYIPTIGRKKPSFAGAIWEFDGTIVDIYHSGGEDKQQLYARIYWIAVIDVKTEAIIGYHITNSETSDAVVKALKSAVSITNTVPHQIRTDNSSAVQSLMKQGKKEGGKNFFEKLAKYVTPAAVGNARAKTIESVFKRFQDSLMRLHPFWAGMNLTVKKDSNRMNRVWIQANIKNAPTHNELISQLEQLVTLWNADTMKKDTTNVSRWQQYKNDADQQRTALRAIFNDAFLISARGDAKTGLITYRNAGLKITWNKQEHIFKVVDRDINSSLIGKKFIVKFDADDLSKIWLYNADGTPFTWQEEHLSIDAYEAAPDYLGDRQEGDGQRIAAMQEEQKEVKRQHKIEYLKTLDRLTAEDMKESITAASIKKDLMNDAEIIAKEMGMNGKAVSFRQSKERQKESEKEEMTLEEYRKRQLEKAAS